MSGYSVEKNVQILIAVMKANGIKKVVVNPGATNISSIASMVNDGSFELYSAVDERGAAYMACGLCAESGEPVALTCTGATASRNYFPALTEAYHRKLPILAVTSSQDFARRGNLSPQFIDRTGYPPDSLRMSVQIPIIRTPEEERDAMLQINRAVLELFRHGGGPVHINLASDYINQFTVSSLEHVRILRRYTYGQSLPKFPARRRVAVAVGNHPRWNEALTAAVDAFCEKYDAVVICDHSSGYWGKYRVFPSILATQELYRSHLFDIDLLIHIGEEHGDYYTDGRLYSAKEVWRVSPDGEIRDHFGALTNTFEMSETAFFRHYAAKADQSGESQRAYYDDFQKEIRELWDAVPELPFSNIWLAQQTIPRFPSDCPLELGVSNTMRAWTFFDFPEKTYTLANTGCRGIDGAVPTLIGMSLANPNRVHFAVMGDLTFFYSFNTLGNRHVGANLRILLVNNGCGAEFHLYPHRAYEIYNGDEDAINQFVAAGGHTGTKSRDLVRHWAEDLGFAYLSAASKAEYLANLDTFLDVKSADKPMIFEVFTTPADECEALRRIRSIKANPSLKLKRTIKNALGGKR